MKTLLTIIISFVNLTFVHAGFSPQQIHEVRAYVYDYTQEKDNKSLLKNGRLHKGIINDSGSKLNQQQIKRLISALRTSKKDDFGARCYMPHHGFVFYNKQGKAIGHIELCFQCGNVDSSPKKLSTRPWDWIELKKILEELKIPIPKKDEDYTKLFQAKQNKNGEQDAAGNPLPNRINLRR